MKKLLFTALLLICATIANLSAGNSLEYIENTFPELTNIFREDIGKCHAHYVFCIDVSGSMDKFDDIVVPCLQRFIQALPEGDKVTVIPFGTEVKSSLLGFSGIITSNIKADLCTSMKTLYKNSNYEKEFRDHTNIFKATNAISNAFITNSEYKVNIGITITDFQNNIPTTGSSNFRLLTPSELEQMQSNFMAATQDCYVRNIALELTEGNKDNQSLPGYCLPQLKNQVYNKCENGLEVASAGNSKAMIEQWFETLRRDILVVKLRAIVTEENKAGEISMLTETNIDGKTTAEINWTPSRLYSIMKIDSTKLSAEGFYFLNDTANYGNTRDREQLLELGQIKNHKWGFSHIRDSIDLGVSLPTTFDTELTKLGITKPLTGTKHPVDRWVFTFFMPFWLTALILLLILIYIYLTFRAWRRNVSTKLKANIFVRDPYGDEVLRKKIDGITMTSIGKGGIIHVDDAEWRISIEKVKPSPFLLFKQPYFTWSCTCGYVSNGRNETCGRLDYDTNTSFNVKCKAKKSDDEPSHSVTVKLAS